MKKFYMVKLQYNGSAYHGWQKQKQLPTLAQAFNEALSKCVPDHVKTHALGASRTDARVHALSQVVKVTVHDFDLSPEDFQDLLNKHLPSDMRVLNVIRTHKFIRVIEWAQKKEYLYLFHNQNEQAENCPYSVNFQEPLDLEKMKQACQLFIGEYDFINFSYRGSTNNTVRKVFDCKIIDNHQLEFNGTTISSYALRIEGNGFLKQMVRLIVGALIKVGNGQITLEQLKESLETGSSTRVGFIAPAKGLVLYKISYPQKYFDKEL